MDTPVALWQRQMVLGPAREFCLLSRGVIGIPEEVGALVVGCEVGRGGMWELGCAAGASFD